VFATLPEGSFVRLHNCRLHIPAYVRFGQLLRASRGRMSAFNALLDTARSRSRLAEVVLSLAERQAGRTKYMTGGGYRRSPQRMSDDPLQPHGRSRGR
jgi:hypothetical protein